MEAALAQLIQDYNEFHPGNGVPVHEGPPTPEELRRIIERNRPVVFKNAMPEGLRHFSWSMEHLVRLMDDALVTVAETPSGRADDVAQGMFVEPHETRVPLSAVAAWLRATRDQKTPHEHVWYVQLQNGNLDSEFAPLRDHIPHHIPWVTHALDSEFDDTHALDAVNIWIGNHLSQTSLHKDPYENFYAQVAGSKRFVLLPPNHLWLLREREFARARYVREGAGFRIEREREPPLRQAWATVDPDTTEDARFRRLAQPLYVTLDAGDILYLPSLWFHKVTQRGDHEGKSISINWWYDMDYASHNRLYYEFMSKIVHESERLGVKDGP